MQASQLWELFEKTGNVGVYILYKKVSAENAAVLSKEVQRSDADSNPRNGDKRN